MSELNTQRKGTITELLVASYLLGLGYNVSQPFSQDSRYDLIVDVDGKMLRLQVKTCRINDSGTVIQFNCRSTTTNSYSNKCRSYGENEIDFFATYWDNKVYFVPVGECCNTKSLRLVPSRFKQGSMADDYLADKILKEYK